jgi:hypothetical protein
MNTIPIYSSIERDMLPENSIWNEPEASNMEYRAILLSKEFEHNAKFVSVNSLDICHIGFVHSFGNKKNPSPISMSRILKLNDSNHHYKISYQYAAGENSIVKKIYNHEVITVENEYILPHTTVARVIFGNYTSTIITNALPISKFKTKLFVKAYRNYLYFPISKNDIFYGFKVLINFIGDLLTKNTMENTLNEDKIILDNIDKTSHHGMHGRFSIRYDKLSSHYKAKYNLYYEYNDTNL